MNYKDKRWKKKRELILKRDNYLCRECKRYGKTTQANTVHHVMPVERHPEYKWSNNNLISLCHECHNSMHDRFTNELTDKGMKWFNKVSPLVTGQK